MSVTSRLICPFVSNNQPLSQRPIYSLTRHWEMHQTWRRRDGERHTHARATLTLRLTNNTAQDNAAPWSRWWRAWARGSAAAGRRRSGWTWAAGWDGAGRNLLEERSEGGRRWRKRGDAGSLQSSFNFLCQASPCVTLLSLLAPAQPDVPISAP